MIRPVRDLIVSTIVLLLLDSIYLMIAQPAFSRQIVSIQHSPVQFRLFSALVCYVLLIGGLNFFVLRRRRPLIEAFLLGLVVYGVYETTNHATIAKWSSSLGLMDTLWGGVLLTATAYATYQMDELIR